MVRKIWTFKRNSLFSKRIFVIKIKNSPSPHDTRQMSQTSHRNSNSSLLIPSLRNSTEIHPIQNLVRFEVYSENKEKLLQLRLEDMKKTFENLGSNSKVLSRLDYNEEKMAPLLSSDVQNILTTTISQMTEKLEQKLRQDNLYQILPQIFLDQQIEKIQSILLSSLDQAQSKRIQNSPAKKKTNASEVHKYCRGKFKLPRRVKQILHNWYSSHAEDPYPSYEQKTALAREAQITIKQVNSWFINMRGRATKVNKASDFNMQIQRKLETGHLV